MFHNLEYSTAVDLFDVFLVEIFVEGGSVLFIYFLPFQLVLVQPIGISKYLFPECALMLKMFVFDHLFVLLEVGVFDLIEVVHRL